MGPPPGSTLINRYTFGKGSRYTKDMNFEKPNELINPVERQRYLEHLSTFLGAVIPAGAVSDESEAERLYRALLQNEPVKRSYVEKIIGQLGDSDDRGSLYH